MSGRTVTDAAGLYTRALRAVNVRVVTICKCEIEAELTDFVIPTDDVPEEARKAIKHWSQMIDYWAVDWDYKDDTFHNQWQSYRTRQEPKIELSAKYAYAEPGS